VQDLGKFGKYRDTAFVYKANYLKNLLKIAPKTILDFGCGIGSLIPYLHEKFKETKLHGCDISSDSIETAKKSHPYCDFMVVENTTDLQKYGKIDCIIINTVMHHIPQDEHETWLNGLYNILSEDGMLVIFEHNMKNPITNQFVKRTKIDENATMLSSKYCKRILLNRFYETSVKDKDIVLNKDSVSLRYTYFSPLRNKFVEFIECFLFWLPLGAQYVVIAQKTKNKGES